MKMTFEEWKCQVDQHLMNLCGMESDDIDDWDYYVAWEDGRSPMAAAKQALEAAMTAVGW